MSWEPPWSWLTGIWMPSRIGAITRHWFGYDMQLKRYRTWIAALMVAITPCTTAMWLQFRVSGSTWNSDGSRNLGHLAKSASGVPFLVIVSGVSVLLEGFAVTWIVRRFGPITAPRLIAAAAAVGGVTALSAFGLVSSGSAPADRSPFFAFALVFLGGSLLGALLSAEYSIVAALPFTLTGSSDAKARFSLTLDRVVLTLATGATAAALVWIASLTIYSVLHPCNCG
jgi:hypothetical protein